MKLFSCRHFLIGAKIAISTQDQESTSFHTLRTEPYDSWLAVLASFPQLWLKLLHESFTCGAGVPALQEMVSKAAPKSKIPGMRL